MANISALLLVSGSDVGGAALWNNKEFTVPVCAFFTSSHSNEVHAPIIGWVKYPGKTTTEDS